MRMSLVCACTALLLVACGEKTTTPATSSTEETRELQGVFKTVEQLTPVEKEGLDKLTAGIYQHASEGQSPCMLYTTQYFMMPLPDGRTGKQLDKPLVLQSGACVGPHMLLPTTLKVIKDDMENKYIHWKSKDGRDGKLRIADGYLVQNPGGAGGTMYSGNDMVTIVPTKLEIR